MKEMNENQLPSWRLRQPSAALKGRIFGFAGEAEVPTARWLWSCVAPTMACALLTLMALDRDGDGFTSSRPIPLVLNSQNNAAMVAGGVQTKENHLAAVTFDWTNRSVSQSITRFTPTTNLTN